MMCTKTKGKELFSGFSLSCLGRAMVASILSIEPLVVVSLIPKPHLYWSGYKANLPDPLSEEIQLLRKLNCEMLCVFERIEKPTKRRLLQADKVLCECTTSDYAFTKF